MQLRSLVLALLGGLSLLASQTLHARTTCEELAQAPHMPDGDSLRWAQALWASLRATDERLGASASSAAVRWVAGERGALGGAWYCRGDDTVHVSAALVDYAWQGRKVDGASLLGFVLAHELAHRRFDLGEQAPLIPEGHCDEVPVAEVRADSRAAFLLALSPDPTTGRGLSPFQLLRRDSLTAFFANELGWAPGCAAWVARTKAVEASVARMHELGRVYESAVALALLDALPDQLPELMEALDIAVNGVANPWTALPELKLTRALVHLSRAAKGGWCPEALARAPLSPSPCSLRCLPVTAAHASLAPFDPFGARAPMAFRRDEELTQVRRLLDEAARLGATLSEVAGIAVCEAFLAGDSARRDAAIAQLALAGQRAPVTPDFRAALAGLRATSLLQSFIFEESSPIGSATWLDALRELRQDHPFIEASASGRIISAWLGEPGLPGPRLEPEVDAPQLDAWVRAQPCSPTTELPFGDGWRLAMSPTCSVISSGSGRLLRLVDVAPTALSESIGAWSRYCALDERGTDDAGDTVHGSRCPAWDGLGSGWLLFSRAGTVRRTVRYAP